jgi:hypothetical protein
MPLRCSPSDTGSAVKLRDKIAELRKVAGTRLTVARPRGIGRVLTQLVDAVPNPWNCGLTPALWAASAAFTLEDSTNELQRPGLGGLELVSRIQAQSLSQFQQRATSTRGCPIDYE